MTPREQLEDVVVDYAYGFRQPEFAVTWGVLERAIDRYTRQVKAEALREAADAWSDWDALNAPEQWLRDRADEIEAHK